jgi:hypothetical protein
LIRQVEQYHGAVIARLIRGGIDGYLRVRAHEHIRSAYALDERVGLYIKYATSRLSPWSFGFKPAHQDEIAALRAEFDETFVVLACGTDGVVCLDAAEYARLLDDAPSPGDWIKAARSRRQKYVVTSSESAGAFRVADSEYPAKVYAALRLRA